MKTLKKKVLAASVAAASLAGFIAATPAQAYVMASSVLNMTNFRILGSDGAILDATGANTGTPTGDFQTITFTGTANTSVEIVGVASDSYTAANPPTNPINSPALCVGGACPVIVNDAFPQLTAPPVTGNYAAADQYESGAPVSGLTGFSSPASVGNAAYTGLDLGTNVSSGEANNNLNSNFTFRVTQATGIQLSFDIDAFLQTAVSGEEIFPGFATASASMEFTIVNLTTGGTSILNWTPQIFTDGGTISLNAPLGVDIQIIRTEAKTSWLSDPTVALTPGNLYQASFRMTTEVDAGRVAVPEPSALALMGIGLLGIGAARIRRRYA